MKCVLFLAIFLISNVCTATNKDVDYILVNKAEKKMYLLSNGHKVKEYNVVFGGSPKGHKQQEGDEKTPEGQYILDYKKENSSFYKSIHISYPNEVDVSNAKAKGVKPGGAIMIHGQRNGLSRLSWLTQRVNWTNGCIAVTNIEMDEIWGAVKVGTPIEILP